ncbi:MAG: hypothetical protein V1860_03890 [bacterium]
MILKKQHLEGELPECAKALCECSCCDNDQIEEWTNEYFAFHERMKDHLISKDVKIEFIGDRVRFINCSDGKKCKFLKYSLNKDIDPRPIDCKIYPYVVDWENIDFDRKTVNLYYWDNDCPVVKSNLISDKFKKEVENIIKRDFAFLFYGARFNVKFYNKVYYYNDNKNKKLS